MQSRRVPPYAELNPITVFNVRAAVTVSQFAYDHVLALYDTAHLAAGNEALEA
jgi:hypothetical protein